MKESTLVEPTRTAALSGVVRPERRAFPFIFVWLNLVCLDAPLVALSWQWLFAKTFQVPLRFPNCAALFLTAWLIYLADRFGDSISLHGVTRRSLRQNFCARHRRAWLAAIVVVAVLDALIIGARLDGRVFLAGVAIGLIAVAYLILNHRWSRLWRVLPLKEWIIGFVFAGGVIASLLPNLPARNSTFALAAVAFALLCTLNCICIARWESTLDCAQGRGSIATAWPRVAAQVFWATLVLAGIGLALAMIAPAEATLFLCVSLSAIALAVLDRFGEHLLGDTRTALADLVLLTPLVVTLARAIPALSS